MRYFFPPHKEGFCPGFIPESPYDPTQCRPCWLRYHYKDGVCFGINTEKSYFIDSVEKKDNIIHSVVCFTGPNFNHYNLEEDRLIFRPLISIVSEAKIWFCVWNCVVEFFVLEEEFKKIKESDTMQIKSATNSILKIPLKEIFTITAS